MPYHTRLSVTGSGAYLRSLAPGQHSSEETSQWWRVVGDTVSDLIDSGFKPQTSCTESNVLAVDLTGRIMRLY